MMGRTGRLLAIALLACCAAGCSLPPLIDPDYKTIPEQQADAGFASASVVAIVPLSAASSALATRHTLSFQGALDLVNAYSRKQHQDTMDALQFGLNVGLSGRTRSGTSTTSDAQSGSTNRRTAEEFVDAGTAARTSTTTTTITDSTGKTSTQQSVQTVVQGTATAPSMPGGASLQTATVSRTLTGTVTINPAMALQAADQLMKLANMVSHQFSAIPYNRATHNVYIVQIKTTLQPHKPALPLDAYVTLTATPDSRDRRRRR